MFILVVCVEEHILGAYLWTTQCENDKPVLSLPTLSASRSSDRGPAHARPTDTSHRLCSHHRHHQRGKAQGFGSSGRKGAHRELLRPHDEVTAVEVKAVGV